MKHLLMALALMISGCNTAGIIQEVKKRQASIAVEIDNVIMAGIDASMHIDPPRLERLTAKYPGFPACWLALHGDSFPRFAEAIRKHQDKPSTANPSAMTINPTMAENQGQRVAAVGARAQTGPLMYPTGAQ